MAAARKRNVLNTKRERHLVPEARCARLAGATHNGFHFGDLPGTSAVMSQRTSGVSYTVLMNKNDKFEGDGARKDYPSEVKAGIDAALAAAGY